MTREEAKGFGYGFIDNSSNIQDQYVLLVHEVDEVIDKIYDDIESRVCENCKWLISNEIKRCKLNVASNIHMHLSNVTYDERFGCNKFERKLESK